MYSRNICNCIKIGSRISSVHKKAGIPDLELKEHYKIMLGNTVVFMSIHVKSVESLAQQGIFTLKSQMNIHSTNDIICHIGS